MKYKFCFVILNYITTNDTIECIDSIKKYCSDYNYNIVIVDNASPNKSGEELKKVYQKDSKIKIFINKDNIGFARGNNVGFIYAKEKLHSDFIILCNSDTEILDNSFCPKIINSYLQDNFAVLGPKEQLVDGTCYPLKDKIRTKKQIKLSINKYENLLDGKDKFINKIALKIYSTIYHRKLSVGKRHKNIVLHGAFLIFSKKYIDLFDGLNDVTFFYGEEEFLALRLKKYNLCSVYNPDITILHKKNSATNASNKSQKEKKDFIMKCHLDSDIKLLDAMEGKIRI